MWHCCCCRRRRGRLCCYCCAAAGRASRLLSRPLFPPSPLPLPAAEVHQQFGIRSTVLNDFEAVGYGVPVLTDNDLVTLNDVPAEDKVGQVGG